MRDGEGEGDGIERSRGEEGENIVQSGLKCGSATANNESRGFRRSIIERSRWTGGAVRVLSNRKEGEQQRIKERIERKREERKRIEEREEEGKAEREVPGREMPVWVEPEKPKKKTLQVGQIRFCTHNRERDKESVF